MLIQWFRFRTDPYNFVKIIGEYVRRWDETVVKLKLNYPLFIDGTINGFVYLNMLYYVCENQLK